MVLLRTRRSPVLNHQINSHVTDRRVQESIVEIIGSPTLSFTAYQETGRDVTDRMSTFTPP